MSLFHLTSPFTPSGDQPQAVAKLVAGLNAGLRDQTLLGVKTLAAQLFAEFKAHNDARCLRIWRMTFQGHEKALC